MASPTFTGTVSRVNATTVGLGNCNITTDETKPVPADVLTALNAQANFASPTFTGTAAGINATMVGLGNRNNTTDAAKPVSAETLTALNAKADLDSPLLLPDISTPLLKPAPNHDYLHIEAG